MFFLIGALCGLAIYNVTIIHLPFPLILYKKLLGEELGSLEDLEDLDPVVSKGLKDLLAYQDDDVEDVFMLNFAVGEDSFGTVRFFFHFYTLIKIFYSMISIFTFYSNPWAKL